MNEVADKEFIHLKIHTQYSICEGALRILDLAKHCKTNQIKAAGLCDSNNLCGSLEFSELIAKSRTQPIIGTQINVLYKNHIGKIPLFAKDLEGYKNLIKLSSKSFLEIKDNEEPHCKIEDIENNYKGLILLSGSFDGLIGKLFFKNLSEEIFLLFNVIFKSLGILVFALKFIFESLPLTANCAANLAKGTSITLLIKGTVRLARGFTSRTYTIFFFIAN